MDRWCAANGLPRGEVVSLERVWELSRLWYGDRLSPGFHGRSAAEAEAIFRQMGLMPPFWSAG